MTLRILVAGVGNVFLGDDAFGVEVVRRLVRRDWPAEVRVADFGTRGHDLAYAILDGYDAVILVDAVGRGGEPGTLYTLELDSVTTPGSVSPVGSHDVDLPAVFQLVRLMGVTLPPLYLVGCEPADLGYEDEGVTGLSGPVAAAVEGAVECVEALTVRLLAGYSRA